MVGIGAIVGVGGVEGAGEVKGVRGGSVRGIGVPGVRSIGQHVITYRKRAQAVIQDESMDDESV